MGDGGSSGGRRTTHGGRNERPSAEDDDQSTGQLYPIGKKTFGRKGGFTKIIFGENCLTVNGVTCKKL